MDATLEARPRLHPVRALPALVELARPGNVVMAGLGAVVGALVVGADGPTLDVVFAVAATVLVVAGGNALNDAADVEVDRGAHPSRPIPSGRLTLRAALGFAVTCLVLALALAAVVSFPFLLLVLAAEAALSAYEVHLKSSGLVGNLVVAGLVGATFLAGALAVGRVTAAVGFLAGLAFLANVGREIWKDAEDAAHDAGRRTVTQRWGAPRARRLAQIVTMGAVALSPLPFLYSFGGAPYLVAVGLADAVFIAAVLAPVPARSQRLSKFGMLAALVAFALGGVL